MVIGGGAQGESGHTLLRPEAEAEAEADTDYRDRAEETKGQVESQSG